MDNTCRPVYSVRTFGKTTVMPVCFEFYRPTHANAIADPATRERTRKRNRAKNRNARKARTRNRR